MDKITDKMSGAEIVFLYLGITLFAVLVILLIIYAVQKRNIKPLLFFFILPIIMIGWPTINSFKVSAEGVELSMKDIREAAGNPEKREQLVQLTDSLNKITVTSPDSLKLLAQANALLGDTVIAAHNIEDVLEKNPGDTEALRLKRIYFTPSVVIQKGIEDVNANPADDKAKMELRSALIKEEQKAPEQKTDPLKMAAAHLVLQDTAKSSVYLEKAVIEKPALQNVTKAKEVMMNRYIKR